MIVAGCDEVGRGPLAGDVVAAAVILGEHSVDGLADSKKLSEKRRMLLFSEIQEHALSFGIGRASVAEIDELNILNASLLAMSRAVDAMSIRPDHVMVDGNKLPTWGYSAEAVVGGDALVPAISAASILAKVTRDQELIALDEQYPEYGFAKHKGYPTAQHLRAIEAHGILPIHRRSFGPIARLLNV